MKKSDYPVLSGTIKSAINKSILQEAFAKLLTIHTESVSIAMTQAYFIVGSMITTTIGLNHLLAILLGATLEPIKEFVNNYVIFDEYYVDDPTTLRIGIITEVNEFAERPFVIDYSYVRNSFTRVQNNNTTKYHKEFTVISKIQYDEYLKLLKAFSEKNQKEAALKQNPTKV